MTRKPLFARHLWWCVTLGVATAAGQQPTATPKPSESRIITGRVVSDSGQPIAGATVAAMTNAQVAARTSTDTEGNFKIQGLEPGLYRLSAGFPGYAVPNPLDPNSATFYRPGDSASITLTKGGVIAGFITTINNEPVVNVSVRALRVRDGEGNRVQSITFTQPRNSDDRGYYRLYGLPPGTYIVAAGGPGQYFGSVNPFAKDAPTYAPASTRDTAAEVIVRSDQEVTADIRYRGEPGHAISGKVTGAVPAPGALPSGGLGVRLNDIESRMTVGSAQLSGDDRAFQINGVSDGEYELIAIGAAMTGPNTELSASSPRRITVKGADVTGLELALTPMASVVGRVNFAVDEKLNCGRHRENAARETMIFARRKEMEQKAGTRKTSEDIDSVMFPTSGTSTPNEKGEIIFRNLQPANYRLEIRTPGQGWYVKDLSLSSANPRGAGNRRASVNIAGGGINVKAGDRISDLTITIAEGGAGLRGRLAAPEGQSLPPGLRVYLVPAEREQSDNVLQFFEGTVAPDNTFAMGNIAPGRYWIIAQPAEMIDANTAKSIKSDDTLRAKVLHDAEAGKKEITFKPCERTLDYELPYSP
ncbi:MAG TPA: carboxypeptidase-like regulatory domain-containing protein [Pyrinomonadaceae bacterium]|nr:carboxypeptidase-like regulatory domain-containing protein [Pyrinomonadaceae bacterium]